MEKTRIRKREEARPAPQSRQELPGLLTRAQPWWQQLLLGVFLAVMAVVVFLPAWGGQYIWDDDGWLLYDQPIRQGWAGLRAIWTDPHATPHYYPLIMTGYWFEHKLWGFNPVGYRVVNGLLHAGTALLLWRVLRKLGLRWGWLAALIFAVHPVQVETVVWVAERKNVQSGLFFFAAIYMYLGFAGIGGEESAGAPERRRWGKYGMALFFFVLALLSKTVVCVLPAVLGVLIWWKRGKLRRRDLWPLAPMFPLGLGLAAITVIVEQSGHVGTGGADWQFSLLQRTLIAGHALWFYFGKLLSPYPLLLVYPRWWGYGLPRDMVIPATDYLYPVAAAAAVGTLWWARKWIGRGPLAAVLCFIIILLPALGFINFYTMLYTFVADHYQYLACAAIIALLVESGGTLLLKVGNRLSADGGERKFASRLMPLAGRALAGALVFSLAWQTFWQAKLYFHALDVWTYAMAYNPDCFAVRANYASQLYQNGKVAESIKEYKYVTEVLRPKDFRGYDNLARIYEAQGDLETAAKYKILTEAHKPPEILDEDRRNFGVQNRSVLAPETVEQIRAGDQRLVVPDPAGAEAFYRLALKSNGDHPEIWNRLSMALYQQGRTAEARQAFNEAMRLDPTGHEIVQSLGMAER